MRKRRGKPWHILDPSLLQKEKASIRAQFPNLHFIVEDEKVFLRGTFPLLDGQTVVDRFAIEVEFPRRYPRDMPVVRETGGRMPWTIDRHVLPNGNTCLFVAEERWRVYPEGSSLLAFLTGPVQSFFVSQAHYEITGKWPFGQRSHGMKGIFEHYSELLGTNDTGTILRYINLLRRREVNGHHQCPCGSGQILRHCHREQLEDLRRKIPYETARQTWQLIETLGSLKDGH
jgi:hypothetical protein